MPDWIFAVVVGGLLAVGGMLLVWSHSSSWWRQRSDPSVDPDDLLHFQRRYRRRMQTSGMIALLGVMITIGDMPFIWALGPFWSTIYWSAVLLVTLWIVMLALGDAAATQGHTRASLARVRRQQRELEREAARLRSQSGKGQNGQRRS